MADGGLNIGGEMLQVDHDFLIVHIHDRVQRNAPFPCILDVDDDLVPSSRTNIPDGPELLATLR